eukprot:1156043-Pelagomonas_calceolata.AAC.23
MANKPSWHEPSYRELTSQLLQRFGLKPWQTSPQGMSIVMCCMWLCHKDLGSHTSGLRPHLGSKPTGHETCCSISVLSKP